MEQSDGRYGLPGPIPQGSGHGLRAGQSMLRTPSLTEAVIKGNQATFLVADSGGATPNTRGVNGLIPLAPTISTSTPRPWSSGTTWSAAPRSTSSPRRATAVASCRDDAQGDEPQDRPGHPGELQNGTNHRHGRHGLARAGHQGETILGNNVRRHGREDNCSSSPRRRSAPTCGRSRSWTRRLRRDQALNGPTKRYRRWGFNWIFHPNIVGKGTSLEYCFAFHRNAIGHAVNTGDMQALAGYHEEQDYSWARTTGFMGSKLLQNSGIVVARHDGSAYVAS
jgi:hypothetical protein